MREHSGLCDRTNFQKDTFESVQITFQNSRTLKTEFLEPPLRILSVYADLFSVVFCQHSIYVLRMRTILLCPITFVVFLIKMGFATHRIYGAILLCDARTLCCCGRTHTTHRRTIIACVVPIRFDESLKKL